MVTVVMPASATATSPTAGCWLTPSCAPVWLRPGTRQAQPKRRIQAFGSVSILRWLRRFHFTFVNHSVMSVSRPLPMSTCVWIFRRLPSNEYV